MIPFYYLHAELGGSCAQNENKNRRQSKRPTCVSSPLGYSVANNTTTLSIFGKSALNENIVVRIHQYRINFYVSFRDAGLAAYCCRQLINCDTSPMVVSIRSVTSFQSMLLLDDDEEESDDYGGGTVCGEDATKPSTELANVVRVQVRTRQAIASVIEHIERSVIEHNRTAGTGDMSTSAASSVHYFHSNLDTVTVAMRDLGLDPCRWIYLDTDRCIETTTATNTTTTTREINANRFVGREYSVYDNGRSAPKEVFLTEDGVLSSLSSSSSSSLPTLPPSVRLMSFDIECLSSQADTMPNSARDPVIQISTVMSPDALGRCQDAAYQRHLFTLGGSCDAIADTRVYTFQEEKDMLKAFVDHVYREDPDIMTGYNIENFDFPYLFRRAEVNGVKMLLGRGRIAASCTERNYGDGSSGDDAGARRRRQYTSFIQKTHDTRIPGRIRYDMYTHVRKEFVLRSYTLNSVACHFLNKKKDDVNYKEIPVLFNGDSGSRARLGSYCVKDSQLVLELAFKTQTFVHAFERCKVFRTMLQYLVDRGQQIRFYSMLLAWCAKEKVLVNDVTTVLRQKRVAATSSSSAGGGGGGKRKIQDVMIEREELEKEDRFETKVNLIEKQNKRSHSGYEGATVLEPITGMYRTPVVCLDYASLYPSIMIGYNLCFTTLVSNGARGRELVDRELAEMSPNGHVFLKSTTRKGVLPSILEMLLSERKEVRDRMKTLCRGSDDTCIEYSLLDGQQSALKAAANSIYGAIGCDKSVLHFVAIPSSVTAYGRQLIARTKDHVEHHYRDMRVIYGDTDSVMINMNTTTGGEHRYRLSQCAAIGREMADSISAAIDRRPISLQFETVYRPFLLCTKKRYAAGVYSGGELTDGDDMRPRPTKYKYKGLQVVRRDNCTFATRLMRLTLETLMGENKNNNNSSSSSNDEEEDFVRLATVQLREELQRLFDGRVNMKELVISKELRRKGSNVQPHYRVAEKMRSRDPSSAPAVGERVPYVVVIAPPGIRGGGRGGGGACSTKLCERAEDPLYVLENDDNIRLDLLYYADNQVAEPIAKLFRIVLGGGDRYSLDEIKDMFWPSNAPKRKTDRRGQTGGGVRWTQKASAGSRRITEFFCNRKAPAEQQSGRHETSITPRLVDVEDLLDGLADKCMACKSDDVDAVRSCRDRECETLYERFAALKTRRNIIRTTVVVAENVCRQEEEEQKQPQQSALLSNSEQTDQTLMRKSHLCFL